MNSRANPDILYFNKHIFLLIKGFILIFKYKIVCPIILNVFITKRVQIIDWD